MDIDYIARAEAHLSKQDAKLGQLIAEQTLVARRPRTDYFASLCSSIIGQQVSVAAARAIFSRLEEQTKLDPVSVANITDEQVKSIGLSRQKVSYLRDLAEHFASNPSIYNHLEKCSDDEVISELTAVKGIGTWTAQMFLMSTLARPDVFAADDAGLQRAMLLLYGWDSLPPKSEIESIVSVWAPYRTIASWHLWHSLNNDPT